MRNTNKLTEALNHINLSSIIPVIEKGLEIEKLHFELDKDNKEIQQRIVDTQILLAFFRMRNLNF